MKNSQASTGNKSSSESIPSLENLFLDYHHPNPNINYKAYLDMVKFWPEESMVRLIVDLGSQNVHLRRKAVKALGAFGDKALEPILKVFFSTKKEELRTSCLKTLVKIVALEKYKVMPHGLSRVLNSCLNDPSPQISLAMISLLRQLGVLGLPLLIRQVKSKDLLKAKASVTAIGEIEHPSARECLNQLYEDKETDILIRESVRFYIENSINEITAI